MKIAYVIIGGILLAVLAGAGGFFGGMTYAQSKAQNIVADFARQRASQNQQGNTSQDAHNAANAAGAPNPCGFGEQVFQVPQGATPNDPNAAPGQGQGHRPGGGQFGGSGGFGGAQVGNCVARGQIKAVNGDTVEISTTDKVVTIKVTDATVISKTDRGTLADLQIGDRITVFSQESSDTPTASGIQLQRNLPQPTP